MQRHTGYKIVISLLLFIVILQGIFIIILNRPKKAARKPARAPQAIKGKIAIVIDDWGYNLNNLPILERLKHPLTMSILPNLNYSQRLAKEFHRRGFQIILHLPLEPHEKIKLENNTIMISMDESAIKNILTQDLSSVMYAQGVSNHMGSLATEDLRTMEIVFRDLNSRHIYFLDSFVSPASVCYDLARKIHLPFVKRDVFLDNIDDPRYIRSQIYKLKNRADIYGQAMGIGHDRKNTLEVLSEMMPELTREGYRFVFVSELVR